jgi:hypothetical protein
MYRSATHGFSAKTLAGGASATTPVIASMTASVALKILDKIGFLIAFSSAPILISLAVWLFG